MAEINTVIAEASQDLQTIEDFVNLPAGSDVRPRLLPSVNVGTLAGTRQAIFEAGGLPATPFATKALMVASSLTNGQYAVVTDDIDVNNGLYIKDAGAFKLTKYGRDPKAVRVFGSEEFSESTSLSQYSKTAPIQLKVNEDKLLVRLQSSTGFEIVTGTGVGVPRTILLPAAPIGDDRVFSVINIPSNINKIEVVALNQTAAEFDKTKKPVVIFGNDEVEMLNALVKYDGFHFDNAGVAAVPFYSYDTLMQSNYPDGTYAVLLSGTISASQKGYYLKSNGEWVHSKKGISEILKNLYKKQNPQFRVYELSDLSIATSNPVYSKTPDIAVKAGDKLYINVQSQSGFEVVTGQVAGVRTVLEPAAPNGAGKISKFVSIPSGTTSISIVAANKGYGSYDNNFGTFFVIGRNESEISDYVLSRKSSGGSITPPSAPSGILSNGDLFPSPTLKATRLVNFTDGTQEQVTHYLWHNIRDNKFYLSNTQHGDKHFIFEYKPSDFYNLPSYMFSMGFDKFGNIICVYRIEYDDTSAYSESTRKNPIILLKSNDYKPQVIDFGVKLKPSAWLQNCGFLVTDDAIYIAEYTRPSVKTANTWKATYPISNPDNWRTVQSFDLSPDPSPIDNLKHIHNVERDPFTGVIYTSTGDNNAGAAIYASTDGGNNFSTVLTGSEKYCRVLNFVYTKDYIYWATDSVNEYHWFFKASRGANGIIDASSIVDIQQFPTTSKATYASIYMPMLNIIVFLGREDYGANVPVPIDVFDLTDNTFHSNVFSVPNLTTSYTPAGFRCECFEHVPKTNSFACGFSEGNTYRNMNAVLGNTTATPKRVNNFIVTVNKVAPGKFTFSFETSI